MRSPALRVGRVGVAGLGLVVALSAAGCASTPRKGPRAPQPAEVRPSQLLPSVQFFQDTDANGYYDSVDVVLYVFSDQYPDASISVPGSFTFRLMGKGGRLVREWPLPPEATAAAQRRGPVGPGYQFRLSLLDTGGDRLDENVGELFAEFTPQVGSPVRSVPTTVSIGRTGRVTP